MKPGKKLIAPSILSADFARLGDEIKAVEAAGADIIHIDVMDGHFVQNITVGAPVVKSMRSVTKLPLDCHLMIENPDKYIKDFAEAGADMISVHVEACNLSVTLDAIKQLGVKAGAVINPPTPVETLLPYIGLADFILVMTVNPGFGGQKIIPECIKKIAWLAKTRKEKNLVFSIEADGGINISNIKMLSDAGCDIFVAGSAIFGRPPYGHIIAKLQKNALDTSLNS